MRTWPHAPSKVVTQPGMYIVTAGTYLKVNHFKDDQHLAFLHDLLLERAEEFGWRLEAWAVFSNHYHFVGRTPEEDRAVAKLTRAVHQESARWINERHETPGRRVWYSSWDTLLTFERSYLARLAYVHKNAVHHGIVAKPEDYPYCSARWLLQNTNQAFSRTILEFPCAKANVPDDF